MHVEAASAGDLQGYKRHSGLSISLLGTFYATLDGVPIATLESDRVRALLAYLSVEADRPHRRETLASLLWPDHPENTARRNLRQALYNLRRALSRRASQGEATGVREAARSCDSIEAPYLLITRHSARFNLSSDHWLDVRAFTSRLEPCPAHPYRHLEVCPACVTRLQEAVDLYRDGFLAGLSLPGSATFEEWCTIRSAQFHDQAMSTLVRLAAYYERRRDYERASRVLEEQIELEPWREEAHRQRMRVLALGGQRSAALTQYQSCCRAMYEELGIAPTAETTALYQRIQAGTLEPEWIESSNPYKGLRAFAEADAADFYGRTTVIEPLLQTLERRRATTLIGPSGSGKSSLVFAGLLPRLRRSGTWVVASMRPGADPFRALAGALAPLLPSPGEAAGLADVLHQGEHVLADIVARVLDRHRASQSVHSDVRPRLLVVVDSFEELYTLCAESARRRSFLDLVLGPAAAPSSAPPPLALLLVLRADFMGQALAYQPLADAMQKASTLLGPMSREELAQAIVEPALARGVVYEPGLLVRLLDDLGDEPGNLALLQFTLAQLWARQSEGQFTHAAYDETGGLAGALTCYAEDVYASLSPDEQEAAHRVFTRMVHTGRGIEDARCPVTRAELGEREWRLVYKLAGARLVVTGCDWRGEETAEVVHEALIHTWKRLQDWLHTDLAFHFWLQRLRTAMQQWETSGRDPGALLRGALLAEAQGWVVGRTEDLGAEQRAFVAASVALQAREQAEAQAQRQRELAQARALARAVEVSQSLRLAANARLALRDQDTDLALALALEANRIQDPPPEAQRVLASAAYAPGTRHLYRGHDGVIGCIAIGPDGHTALSGSADGTLILWDLQAGTSLGRFRGHDDMVYSVACSPDGRTALSGSGDGTLIQWDLATGQPLQRLRGHDQAVFSVAYHPDGKTALSGSCDCSLILWDLASGEALRRYEGHREEVRSVAVSPDGRMALSGSADHSVICWDVESGTILHRLAGHDGSTDASAPLTGHMARVRGVAFGPAGDTALSVSEDRSVILWDLRRGELQHRFELLGVGGLYGLDLSADSRRALLNTRDGPAILLNLQSGRITELGFGRRGRIETVILHPDGRHALCGASNGDMRLSDLYSGAEVRCIEYNRRQLHATSVDVSPDGRRGLTGFRDGSVILWDMDSGDEVRRLVGHTTAITGGVHFGRDGRTAVSGAGGVWSNLRDDMIRLWDVESGTELGRLEGHREPLSDIDLSRDGHTLVSASCDGTVRMWDISTILGTGASTVLDTDTSMVLPAGPGQDSGTVLLDVHPQRVRSVALSPDGRAVLVGLGGGRIDAPDYSLRLLDVSTGREIRRFVGHRAPVFSVAYSPDGRLALSGAFDGTVYLWDADSGQVVRRLDGHTGGVLCVAFGPEGRFAASSAQDETVIVWDVATGEARRRFLGHRGEVPAVCFTPGGRTVISAGADLTVREWRIDATQQELRAWIEANRYVLELTPEQRKQVDIGALDAS